MNIKFYIFHCDNIKAIINPYNPNASAKISIKIIPTNIFSQRAFARTQASPTTPIAYPAAFKYIFIIKYIIIYSIFVELMN